MMNKILSAFILFTLVACGSTPTTKEEQRSNPNPTASEEFEWLESVDFEQERELPFIEANDVYPEQVEKLDILSSESLARVPKPKLDIDENSADPLTKVASLCYARNFDDSFKVLSQQYNKLKSHPSYWNILGTCYFLQGDERKALLFYNKARAINGRYVPAINNLGVIYQRQGNDQKALAAYKKASEVNAFSLTPNFNMAQIYLQYGHREKAKQTFVALYKKEGTDPELLNALAFIYILEGEPKKALTLYSRIDSRKFELPEFGLNYAYALKASGRLSDAQSVFGKIDREGLGAMEDYYNKVQGELR